MPRRAQEKWLRASTTLSVGGHRRLFTLFDIQLMRDALRDFLRTPQPTRMHVPNNLLGVLLGRVVGPAFIDPDGSARMGSWLLDVRDETLVLVERSIPPGGSVVGIQFVAQLEQVTDVWQVASLDFERVPHRQARPI